MTCASILTVQALCGMWTYCQDRLEKALAEKESDQIASTCSCP